MYRAWFNMPKICECSSAESMPRFNFPMFSDLRNFSKLGFSCPMTRIRFPLKRPSPQTSDSPTGVKYLK